jgi:beta-glucosidase
MRFGDRLDYVKTPSPEKIRSADVIICTVGTRDSEGWDRPFELPQDQEDRVLTCIENNNNTVVIVMSGGGVRMTAWNEWARAVLYAWYGGQTGYQALAEIIAGEVNPSGKLPITIEKDFMDSPGYGYIPKGETLYTGWNDEEEKKRDVYDIPYSEGIFVGYRWYEKEKIEPLYPFGHGLSYTSFQYSDLKVAMKKFTSSDVVEVTFRVRNDGKRAGKEIVQR